MAYIINRFSGTQLIVLDDGTIDVSTSIGLVGRNYTGYGEIQNENFVYLLENFANTNPPSRPLSGQTWFNSQNDTLNVYDGVEWKAVGSAVVSDTQPSGSEGGLWIDSKSNQLYSYNNGWILVGPEAVENFGTTKARARSIRDAVGILHPILELVNNDQSICIISSSEFSISIADFIDGFSNIKPGINLNARTLAGNKIYSYTGDLIGNAESSSRLANPRKINGINFDGQTDITITSATPAILTSGSYLTGSNFNGSSAATWDVDATPDNTIGTIVARDSAGNFSAGTITANLVGDVVGNVNVNNGTSTFNIIQAARVIGATFTGNAFTATKLETPRTINGTLFDGTNNITITASSDTLIGNTLSPTVTASSLTSVGFLNNLAVGNTGITVGNNNSLRIFADENTEDPILSSQISGKSLYLQVIDSTYPGSTARIGFLPSDIALSLGGGNFPSFTSLQDVKINLGHVNYKWKNVYSELFVGTATTAQYADLAENYLADSTYEPGTVLMFGGSNEVTLAEKATKRVAGIVSTNPAYLMNTQISGKFITALALQGRVPCKVTGLIKKGDMLISAGNGYAISCDAPEIGTIIGKSLEDFDGLAGIIEVVVGRL